MDRVAAIQRKVAAVSNASSRVKFRENVANIFFKYLRNRLTGTKCD